MSELWPAGPYESALSVRETEHAIVMIKDFFQLALSTELNLTRVTAPLFVQSGTRLERCFERRGRTRFVYRAGHE